MADDITIDTAATPEASAKAPVEKKTRKPRAPKVAAADASTVDATAASAEGLAKKTRAKRGSKTAPAKAETIVAEPKKVTTRAPGLKTASAPAASINAIDDIADLIKLEEENKQLRKELSEKLRSENADLRKRLGKA